MKFKQSRMDDLRAARSDAEHRLGIENALKLELRMLQSEEV